MKTLQISIIVILASSLIIANNHVIADNSTSTAYGGLVGFRQADFKSDHGSYPIWYKLINGTVIGTPLDLPARELIFRFIATGDGQLTVELPRDIIDSTRDGRDKPYLVSVDDMYSGTTKRVKADEVQTTNASRTLTIDFTKEDNEIGIVGTYFVENKSPYTISNSFGAWSPLQQYEKGFDALDIVCKQDLQLVIKSEDETPACVKISTAFRLSALGWGYLSSPFITKTDLLNSKISGGMIKEFQYDLQPRIIIIKIQTISNGTLVVTIPKIITDLNPTDKPFKDFHTVLDDGMEQNVDLVPTANGSSFTISFTNGTQEIEIIGNQVGQQN